MKRFVVLSMLSLLFSLTGLAQKNNLKINVLSLGATNISLQDEYSISGNSSIALGVSYLPERGLPSFAIKDDPSNNAKNLKLGGFSITPEYRYYFKGNGPKGLYLAGYFRYAKYTTKEYDFTYDKSSGSDGTVRIEGDFTSSVFGIMLGSQWLLGEKWTLDWWIIGAGFGSQKGEYEGTGTFSNQDQTDIQNEVNSIDLPVADVAVTTSSSSVKVTIEPKYPAFRGFGLCLGYRF